MTTRWVVERSLAWLTAHRRSARAGWVSPLGYNLTISHSHRFVWYRVAKVATRTIRHHCETHGVSMDVDHAMRIRYPVEVFGDYFKFAFVRDPRTHYIPMQTVLSRDDALMEYLRHTGSGLFAIPPGVRRGEYVGQGLFSA